MMEKPLSAYMGTLSGFSATRRTIIPRLASRDVQRIMEDGGFNTTLTTDIHERQQQTETPRPLRPQFR